MFHKTFKAMLMASACALLGLTASSCGGGGGGDAVAGNLTQSYTVNTEKFLAGDAEIQITSARMRGVRMYCEKGDGKDGATGRIEFMYGSGVHVSYTVKYSFSTNDEGMQVIKVSDFAVSTPMKYSSLNSNKELKMALCIAAPEDLATLSLDLELRNGNIVPLATCAGGPTDWYYDTDSSTGDPLKWENSVDGIYNPQWWAEQCVAGNYRVFSLK